MRLTERPENEPETVYEEQVVGINRVVMQRALWEATSAPSLYSPPLLPFIFKIKDSLSERPIIERFEETSLDLYGVLKQHKGLAAAIIHNQYQVGGDYLELRPDATLEILQMVAKGEVVDYVLRYRRPGVPGYIGLIQFDDMLHYQPYIG